MPLHADSAKHYLLASDFDQTLSFNDSGRVLSELIGASSFDEKVAGLARTNLVQQGGELAYLIRHDPEFRSVRREHLEEAGRRVRLKKDIPRLVEFLTDGIDGYRFSFRVISAAPREVVLAALEGIVPPSHIFGTELAFDEAGEVQSIVRVPAGYGKVAVLGELEAALGIGPGQSVYVGDGSSDVHVMLHVNSQQGLTIAVSDNPHLARIASRTVLSDSAFAVAIPVLEDVLGWRAVEIRRLLDGHGIGIEQWDRERTDRATIRLAGDAVAS